VTKQSILDECREKILSKIGEPVKFGYPKFGKMKGILVDRVVMHNKSITRVKDMFRVIDLIEFGVHGGKEQLVRFGYYIYEGEKLRWGSQTTYSDTPNAVAALFIMACGRPWFKDIMLRVCKTG